MSEFRDIMSASISKLRHLSNSRERGKKWIGNIDRIFDGTLEGWIKNTGSDSPVRIDVMLDGAPIATEVTADRHRQDVEDAGIGSGRFGFICPVPADRPVEGARLEVRLAATRKVLLEKLVTPQMLQIEPASIREVSPTDHPKPAPVAKCEGRLESLTEDRLRGWASDTLNRGRLFEVEVLVDGVFLTRIRNNRPRSDLARHGKSRGLGGFELKLFLSELEPGPHSVTVVLPDGQELTKTVTSTGSTRRYPLNVGATQVSISETAIIVPIYNAAEDVETCIRRLVEHTPPELEVVLIDDASPDPRIADILADAAGLPGFRVLHNATNLGFTRTINRGLEEIGKKHAILLNSDARVTPGWAQGMLRAAGSRPRVATVTAMSDRAGAFSAPNIGNDNKLPDGVDEITYARAFRRRSLGIYPAVPTGNGFCMFVNRACIDEIGPLDAEAFPRGYGEENDFCMRAGRAGWTHLIDDRTYVFHDRSKSFGETKTDLLTAGRRIVDERYPEYKLAIRVFSASSDLMMARYRAAQALADCSRPDAGLPVILYVVATQTGGTPQTNMDLMAEVSDEMAPWLLHCDSRKMTLSRLDGSRMTVVRSHELAEPVDPLTHRSGEYDAVLHDWLDIANPRVVHIRHLAWHSLSLPALARARGSRVVFSFHDFYTLCPTVKLMDERNVFCGGTCTKTSGDCAIELWAPDSMPRLKGTWVHVWRQRFAEALRDCDAYVTTSESARDLILRHLPLDPHRFFVIPHGRNFTEMEQLRDHPRHGKPVRILVPGNISTAKGRDVIKALLEHDSAGLLEFHILGKISDPEELAHHQRLIMHGTYKRNEFSRRVASIRPHIGAVLSIWDETYCHTLTELWSAGVPAIVFDFPTVATRTRNSGAGWVVPHGDIPRLYERLLEIGFDEEEQRRADMAIMRWQKGHGVGRTTKVMSAAYREVYRNASGQHLDRPVIAVVCPATPEQDRANASTEIRIWQRTTNGAGRKCVFVRMTPDSLLANLRDGIVDGVILQRDVIPATMVAPLLNEMRRSGISHILDIDDDLLAVPSDKDPTGKYAAYRPALEALIDSAAMVTTSTEPLRRKLMARNPQTLLLPNRISEQLWRGSIPPREQDDTVRALYMGTATHREDFNLIAPALEALVEADPGFRVSIIGIQGDALPPWAERIAVPDSEKSYARFVPWLKSISGRFDFGLAPLTDDPFNLFKSNLKALDYGALGLPVLASDIPVYRSVHGQIPGLRLVRSRPESWTRALTEMVAEIRAGAIDRAGIRAATMAGYGMASTLEEFDDLLLSIARPGDMDRLAARPEPADDNIKHLKSIA
ncbi:glycosyltransferase [Rhodovulum sp. YEN HP10]|uniref:glycosyltransferase n=1 Tax=Rhodovulum sp. HP10 TaxID=3387397 RepID=UPI0039E0B1AE